MTARTMNDWDGGRFDIFHENDELHGCESCCLEQCVSMGATQERAKTGTMSAMVAYFASFIIVLTIVSSTEPDFTGLVYFVHILIFACIGCRNRMKMIEKYNLPNEGAGMEFLCWCFCGACSTCQEYRTSKIKIDIDGDWIGSADTVSTIVVAQQV